MKTPCKEVTIDDGTGVWLRPILPEDEPGLSALYARLSRETAYQRFFTVMARLPPKWAHILAQVDYDRRMAIVALGPGEELIAVARYAWDDRDQAAEIAIVVQDAWQGKGLGRILLTELCDYAQEKGITRFRAYVLSDNRRMLRLASRVLQVVDHKMEAGVTSLLLVKATA